MKQNWTAVLHLKYKDSTSVNQLASKVLTNMSANQATFQNIEPALNEVNDENVKLANAISAIDGTEKAQLALDAQTEVVYNLLKDLIVYVNKVAKGNQAVIILSGFDYNNEPVEHDIPGKALIKRIVDGSTPCSAKIHLDAVPDADRYRVETSTTPHDAESWKWALDAARNKLELQKLERGKELFIRVTAGNTHGYGIPSESVGFIPR